MYAAQQAAGQQGEPHPEPVGGRPREHEDVDPDPGHDGADQVGRRARADEGHGQRAEELQRRRQAQVDAAERRVEAEVHRGEDQRQQQRGPPLRPGEATERRPGDRQQHRGGDQLADGHHAGHPDGGVREGADGRAHLRRRRAPGHGQGAAEQAGAAPGRRRRGTISSGSSEVTAAVCGARAAAEKCGRPRIYTLTHDRRPAPAAGPGRGGRGGHVHRRGDRARHVPGLRVAGGRAAGGRPGARVLSRTTRTSPRPRSGPACSSTPARRSTPSPRWSGPPRTPTRSCGSGYAWSALGEHTAPVQRRWAADHPGRQLVFVGSNTPTAGLAEGLADVAVLRRPLADPRFVVEPVGQRGALRGPAQHRPAGAPPHRDAGRLRRPHAGGRPAHRDDGRAPVARGLGARRRTARCTGSRTCSPSWSPGRRSA